jgi:hypothetical protein
MGPLDFKGGKRKQMNWPILTLKYTFLVLMHMTSVLNYALLARQYQDHADVVG